MNQNEQSKQPLSQKGLRNSFISSKQELICKNGDKMNSKKASIIAITAILLVSSIAVTIEFAAAKPTMMGNLIENMSNRHIQSSWVRLNGNIDQWGTQDVRGELHAQARTSVHESSGSKSVASASAIWTTNLTRQIQSVRSRENFTYVFYVARLPNSTLTTDGNGNFTFSGTWNYAKVTSTVTVYTDENGTITRVHRDQDATPLTASGELKISGGNFTLSINGIDTLSGVVHRSITRAWFNPFKMTDDSSSSIVTHSDVKAIGKCYGNMPGWGNFDDSMDFNHNYRIDVADISTVASNM